MRENKGRKTRTHMWFVAFKKQSHKCNEIKVLRNGYNIPKQQGEREDGMRKPFCLEKDLHENGHGGSGVGDRTRIWSHAKCPREGSDQRGLLWVELFPPKRYIQDLTPSTCECDRYSDVKMKSYWTEVGSNPMNSILVPKGKFGHRHTHTHRENNI